MESNSGKEKDGKKREERANLEPDGDDFGKKLHDSVSGLVSSAFGGSVAASSALASSTTGEGKGEASRTPGGPKESSTWAQGASRSSGPSQSSANASLQEGAFRSKLEREAGLRARAQRELDDFQEIGEDPLTSGEETSFPAKGKGKKREIDVFSRRDGTGEDDAVYERAWNQQERGGLPTLQPQGDGADVVALLSDPSFQPRLSFEEDMSLEGENADDEDDPFTLSPAELRFIEKLKATMPSPAVHKPPSPTNPLNLLPDLRPAPDSLASDSRPSLQATTPLHAEESYPYHSTNAITCPRQQGIGLEPIPGLEPWFEVINSYHEDVWGYLKPYAQAAKDEVEKNESQGGKDPTSGPAVRRLGMILAHLDEGFNDRTRSRR